MADFAEVNIRSDERFIPFNINSFVRKQYQFFIEKGYFQRIL